MGLQVSNKAVLDLSIILFLYITRKSIIEFTHFESPSSSWHAQYLAVTLLKITTEASQRLSHLLHFIFTIFFYTT